jgi:hypothetical protein
MINDWEAGDCSIRECNLPQRVKKIPKQVKCQSAVFCPKEGRVIRTMRYT